ncbi:MAG: hypothetical protein WCJ37_10125 [Syntrophus sp. (in: bacteria)]
MKQYRMTFRVPGKDRTWERIVRAMDDTAASEVAVILERITKLTCAHIARAEAA